jgi:hypothetical protein
MIDFIALDRLDRDDAYRHGSIKQKDVCFGENTMGGIVPFVLFYGVMVGLALGLYFTLRAVKLI